MKKTGFNKSFISVVSVALAASLGLFAIGKADGILTVPVQFEVVGNSLAKFGAAIASVTHFTDVTIDNDFTVTKNTTLTGTSTIDVVSRGSSVSKALTFTAGSTTTPGSLFSLQNTGADKICNGLPEINLTAKVHGSMDFAIGTSTSATAWSNHTRSLMSTTTVPTSSKTLLGNENPGTFFGGSSGQASTTQSWVWADGVYILGALDRDGRTGGRNNASSTDYTAAAGSVYVNCHSL